METRETRTQKRKREEKAAPPAAAAKKRFRLANNTVTVISWNMQGGGSDTTKAACLRSLMKSERVVAICLQECGSLFGWPDGDGNLPEGWSVAHHQEWDAGGGNDRCSLAILTRFAALQKKTSDATWAGGRPLIGVKIGSLWIYSVHAPSGANAGYVASVVTAASTNSWGGAWICAGDFNLAPGVVPPPLGAEICNCDRQTQQSGNELDYAYVGGKLDKFEALRSENTASDHWPVHFRLTYQRSI